MKNNNYFLHYHSTILISKLCLITDYKKYINEHKIIESLLD